MNEAIDRIAGIPERRQDARTVAAEMTAEQTREAAIIHLATLLSVNIEEVAGDSVNFGGFSVRMTPSNDPSAPIRYEDVGTGFQIEGVTVTRMDGPSQLASLLTLLSFARDGSDGLLYLPSEMRNARIASVADHTGSSERFVRHLVGHYEQIAAKAAA